MYGKITGAASFHQTLSFFSTGKCKKNVIEESQTINPKHQKKSGGKKRKTTFLKWVSLIKAGSMRITVKNAPKGKWN